jgi:hypothetical protein
MSVFFMHDIKLRRLKIHEKVYKIKINSFYTKNSEENQHVVTIFSTCITEKELIYLNNVIEREKTKTYKYMVPRI